MPESELEIFGSDVTHKLPTRWDATPGDYFDQVPVWPQWALGRSTFGGGAFTIPFFVASYLKTDYAISQDVDWEGRTPLGPAPRIRIDALERLSPDHEYPWTWSLHLKFDASREFEGGAMIEALASIRARLPEILNDRSN